MTTLDATQGAPAALHPATAAEAGHVSTTSWWEATIVHAQRNLAHIRQLPEKLLDVTAQPIMFTLLFAYVFGGAIGVKGGSYREFLMAGILVQSLSFAMAGPATSMATDLTEGVLDRFRSLPAKRSSYLAGHVLAELAGMGLSVVIMTVTGLIVGWRAHEGVLRTVAAFALIALFAFAMVWVGTLIGLLVRTPDAVMGVGFTLVFPLTFISNAFVPVRTLPGPLRAFAQWNPVSVVVAATRQLFGNTAGQLGSAPSWPLAHPVPVATASCLAIIAVTVPLCLLRFRSRTTG